MKPSDIILQRHKQLTECRWPATVQVPETNRHALLTAILEYLDGQETPDQSPSVAYRLEEAERWKNECARMKRILGETRDALSAADQTIDTLEKEATGLREELEGAKLLQKGTLYQVKLKDERIAEMEGVITALNNKLEAARKAIG